jgi:hypothetical protein
MLSLDVINNSCLKLPTLFELCLFPLSNASIGMTSLVALASCFIRHSKCQRSFERQLCLNGSAVTALERVESEKTKRSEGDGNGLTQLMSP